jgi:hypothetical protein
MMGDDDTLPVSLARGWVSTLYQLAQIPEEEIWLQAKERAHPTRAYRQDMQHFMRTLGITAPEELRQAERHTSR